MLRQIHLLQYFIYSLLSFIIAQVTLVPDLTKAPWQYMLLISSYKLFSRQGHQFAGSFISIVFILKGDIVICVNLLYAMIDDGNLVGVSAKVFYYLCRPAHWFFKIRDPLHVVQ